MIHKLIAVFLLCLGTNAWGQAPVNSAILIKAGKLFDARSGHMLTKQAILIEGDRIKEVGEWAVVAGHAASARTIDLSSATLMPGLIDCHAHVLANWKDLSPTRDLRTSSAQGVLWGIHNFQIWFDHGFTALRDAGEPDAAYAQFALRNSINTGLIRGPRMVSAGSFVSITGGHGDSDVLAPDWALPRRPNLADNVDQLAEVVRRDLKYGADWIKLMATGGVSDELSDFNVQELSEEQMAKAVEVAHRARKKVMAHAEGAEGIKAAVRAGVDSIEHGTMLDEEGAILMAQKGTWLVPTLNTFLRLTNPDPKLGQTAIETEKTREIVRFLPGAFQRALQHHLKIAFGEDDDPDFLDDEFVALIKYGMKPAEALQAATVNGAELLGLSDQIGSLEAGKFADVIAVSGDPLADITNMEKVIFVMKGGEIIKNTEAVLYERTSSDASPRDSEAEVRRVQDALIDAYIHRDTATMDRILADEYTFVADDGTVLTKKQTLDSFKSGARHIASYKRQDDQVRVYGDVAILTYRYQSNETYKGRDDSSDDVLTRIFVKRNGRWQIVSGQETRVRLQEQ